MTETKQVTLPVTGMTCANYAATRAFWEADLRGKTRIILLNLD
jgi:hypothetical protein